MTTSACACDALLEYFPAGTAEGERHILSDAFVAGSEYVDLMTPPPFNPRLLVGKKGTGKSALIDFFLTLMRRGGVPALLIKPMDIDIGDVRDGASVGQVTRLAYNALIRALGAKLGESAEGLLSAGDKILYEEAVSGGLKRRDAIDRLSKVLPKLAKPYVPVDLSALIPQASAATRHQLESAIETNLRKSGVAFYLFLDDTDQVAAPDQPGHLNRIWAFLLAARTLAEKFGSLKIVISLREEVWRRLTRDKAGQRDQTDHFVSLVRDLLPSRQHIEQIVVRRLELAKDKLGLHGSKSPWEIFFDGASPRMPSSDDRSSWPDLIVQRSRERPRDAIQLVNALARHAQQQHAARITDAQFALVMKKFSAERVGMLSQEVEPECAVAREIVRSVARIDFDRGSFKISPDRLRAHLLKLPSMFSISLFGRTMQPEDDDSAFEMWRFLWDMGVINARARDNTQKDGYRHVYPHNDSGLVAKSRWNEMQTMTWEINPVYRDYLISIQHEIETRR